MHDLWQQYVVYLVRWQLSTPILWGCLLVFKQRVRCDNCLVATVVANLVGGLLFFWVDKLIFNG